ncbi:MAG: molecular chaperone TorD family protein [Gammaproteobacteria bacterium]|nr:molecular chaperone TorD family protein [Gammaproteobacteria bacterium]MDH3859253.1 molecular chaperone TorD family protein [Gammaproteobacteria bacterium]
MSTTGEPTIEPEQRYRASAYALLAALLRAPPEQALLDHVVELSPESDPESDELSLAMAELAGAAQKVRPADLEDEYNRLFIGLGGGEVVPYGSWYLTGYLMEQPLSDLRDDLRALGFERNPDVSEPEDHAAAIFEVFSVMITDSVDLERQRAFFERHMKSWISRFFDDLSEAKSADFYGFVARFGVAFYSLEKTYLSMQI